ncbi:GNAT family N-acetyltransferase [Patescibacteria group bacterium]|nr:GNAT family N-acetyltransferase [Patescibacteria group bacterium]
MILISQPSPEDVHILQHLNHEVFLDNQKYDDDLVMGWALSKAGERYFSRLLSGKGNVCFIAYDGQIPVGYIACSPKKVSYRKSRYLEIDNMGVVPAYRSKGIGTKLVSRVKQWAKQHHYQKLFVNSYFHNSKAIAFYRRNGFAEIDLGLEMGV